MRLASALLAATLIAPAAAPAAPVARAHSTSLGPRLEPFSLEDVRLLDGPFLEMQRRGLAYL